MGKCYTFPMSFVLVQTCCGCDQVLVQADFTPSNRGRGGRWCRPCCSTYFSEYAKSHPRESTPADLPKTRARHLRTKYGMTLEDYDRLLAGQDGRCAVCRCLPSEIRFHGRDPRLHVDHCHETNEIRGLLCPDCNMGLGKFSNSPQALRAAADYLESPPSQHRAIGEMGWVGYKPYTSEHLVTIPNLSDRVAAIRQAHGLRLADVARSVGCTKSTVSRVESGHSKVKAVYAQRWHDWLAQYEKVEAV